MTLKKSVLRFIAGKNVEDAISRVKALNKANIKGIVDHLGEEISRKEEVSKALSEYLELITRIKNNKLHAVVDIKLTNLGLCIDEKYCIENTRKIISYANKSNIDVWIDAEQYKYWPSTLKVYLKLAKEFPNIFLTIQSYLRNSEDYLKKTLLTKRKIRLVKGTYKESSKVAFTSRTKIRSQYVKLLTSLFKKSKKFVIATHDNEMIQTALKLQKQYNRNIEFQFLMGLADKLKKDLQKQGYKVAEYVPYGINWKGYYQRRLEYLKEKTKNK